MRSFRFARKRKPKVEGSFSAKDVITIVLSSLALLFSGLSLYFSVLRETDDLRLVVSKFPDVQIVDRDHLSLNDEFSISLINGGNRPAMILRYSLIIDQPVSDNYCGSRAIQFESDTEPVIVKAGEALSVKVKLSKPDEEAAGVVVPTGQGRWLLPISDRSEEDFAQAQLCLDLDVATPSVSYERVQLKILRQSGRLDKEAPFFDYPDELQRPFQVIRRWGVSFLK